MQGVANRKVEFGRWRRFRYRGLGGDTRLPLRIVELPKLCNLASRCLHQFEKLMHGVEIAQRLVVLEADRQRVGWPNGAKAIATPSRRRTTSCSLIGLRPSHVTATIRCRGVHSRTTNQRTRNCMLARTTEQMPRAIAASVTKTGEHAELELALREVRGQLDARRAEVRALTARSRDTNRLDREVAEKGGEVSELREQRDELARRLAPLRAEHGRRVVETLAPHRREAAAQALAALPELRAAFALLDEIPVEIERPGGSVERLAPVRLDGIESALRRAAGK